jgi:hypothetical protein
MRRVGPSALVREGMGRLLSAGTDPGTNIVSALAELGLRFIAQQALEQEQEDHLGRGRYERREEHQLGYRNGYEDARLATAEGEVTVRVPQVRGGEAPYRSKLIEFLAGHSDVLEREEERRRTKVIPRFSDERQAMNSSSRRSPGPRRAGRGYRCPSLSGRSWPCSARSWDRPAAAQGAEGGGRPDRSRMRPSVFTGERGLDRRVGIGGSPVWLASGARLHVNPFTMSRPGRGGLDIGMVSLRGSSRGLHPISRLRSRREARCA